MKNTDHSNELAVNGGQKVRDKPFPGRYLIGAEEKAAVDALFDKAIAGGDAIGYNGEEEQAYCREFAEYMGGGYADGVNSGTAGLFIALRALNIEPFTEVVVSPVTDPGGMMPIVLHNCIPVIADSAKGCYNTNAEEIEKVITPLTRVIIAAHIGGEPLDIEPIIALGKKYGIYVIEDCSQSHHAAVNGKIVGNFGDIAVFSTMYGKHHCSGGQGGLVFTKKEDLYWRIRQAADRGKPFGLPPGSTNVTASLNFNMDEISAAIGREQLKKLPGIVERRRAAAAKIAAGIKHLRSVKIPPAVPGSVHSYWWWRLEIDTSVLTCGKNEFCNALSAEGILLNADYRAMPHLMDWYRNKNVFGNSGYPWMAPQYKGDPDRKFPCPNTMEATEKQFILIVYESWGDEEIKDIISAFEKVERAYLK
jgi:perosamine synthetase